VLDATNTQYKIRLMGIDAPEKKQAFGNRSKQSLSDLVFDKQVTVEYSKQDRYGRTIGKITVDGVDANLEQIKAGMAWHYKKYQKEQSVEDRFVYANAEIQAQYKKRGLLAEWTRRSSPRQEIHPRLCLSRPLQGISGLRASLT
jgi:endonuclease YncB( thermonuclease family)